MNTPSILALLLLLGIFSSSNARSNELNTQKNNWALKSYTNHYQQKPDSTKVFNKIMLPDSLDKKVISDSVTNISDALRERTVNELFDAPESEKFLVWSFNGDYLSNEISKIDTSLWMNHLIYPQQNDYETYTFLGNLGSPSQHDHFFSRDNHSTFFFGRFYSSYSQRNIEVNQYNVKSPLTNLFYSTGGARSEAEQIFKVFHTQNFNKYFNIGVRYNYFGTKGVYNNQETRDNLITLFGNYIKGNIQSQFAFSNKVYVNEENGGVQSHSLITDSTYNEIRFIPVWLSQAESTTRERSISGIFGYTLLNIKSKTKDENGEISGEKYIPLVSAKLLLNHERFSRVFNDPSPDSSYYDHFYINPLYTRDSVSFHNTEAKIMIEIAQFAKFPGLPGLKAWVGYDHHKYYNFEPYSFIQSSSDRIESTSHFGIGAFSDSPYLSYNGIAKIFFEGYRADDKEIIGNIRISPWRSKEMPQLKGSILISETTPDVFLRSYFSNHFRWNNNFEKEKRFKLGVSLEATKWSFEVGYNLMHLRDFIYFNQNALPSQTEDVTVTSAYVQKNFKFWKGFNLFSKVVWQANTNSDVLSLPTFSTFSAFFYERVLVDKALTGQLGFNITYRTKFYADAYHPALAQFYSQRSEEVGNYPVLDLFANFKWKRAIIFVKYEHLNQGYPDNQYFATYLNPMNPQIFKFGVSWTFYD